MLVAVVSIHICKLELLLENFWSVVQYLGKKAVYQILFVSLSKVYKKKN